MRDIGRDGRAWTGEEARCGPGLQGITRPLSCLVRWNRRGRRWVRAALPSYRPTVLPPFPGAVAQLGERLDRTQEVRGSSPLSSTREVLGLGARC